MSELLKPFIVKFILVYLDDILRYCCDEASHMELVRLSLSKVSSILF